MLQITPQTLAALRKAQEASDNRLRQLRAKASGHRLNRDRRCHLIDVAVHILKQGEASKYEFEAFCRHDLRSRLCLEGWRWSEADTAAADVVGTALNRIGAERPTWKQGQPEYTQEGFAPIERTRCVSCGDNLPEENRLFCSRTCFERNRNERRRQWENAYDHAVRSAPRWRFRQPVEA